MLNTKKYDFSEEATFKDKLLSRCKDSYNKALSLSAPMSDDELELVTAAGVSLEGGVCPNRDLPCEKCDKYLNKPHLTNHCTDGCRK